MSRVQRVVGDGSSAISAFRAILNCEDFSDVSFTFEGTPKVFHAHRCLLAARSEVFRNMFFGGMKESVDRTVHLEEVDADCFFILLEWAYTGTARMSPDEVLGVLQLAKLYCFDDLEQLCRGLASGFIDEPNVLVLLNAALRIGEEAVTGDCLHFLEQACGAVVGQAAWLQLCRDGLERILALTTLDCPESDLFRRTVEWVHHNISGGGHEAEAAMAELLAHVRLPQLPTTVLLDEAKPLCIGHADLLGRYVEAVECKALPERFAGKLSTMPRTPSVLGKVLAHVPASLLNGWHLVCHDSGENLWALLSKVDTHSFYYVAFGEASASGAPIGQVAVGHLRRALQGHRESHDGDFYWHTGAASGFGVSLDSKVTPGSLAASGFFGYNPHKTARGDRSYFLYVK